MTPCRKVITGLLIAVLADCAGQASPQTLQSPVVANASCAAGEPLGCYSAQAMQTQANSGVAPDVNAKGAAAGAGAAAILLLGLVAAGSGGYHQVHN